VLRTAAPGRSWLGKAHQVGEVIKSGRSGARSLVELRCQRGAAVARAIGLGEAAARAILELDEHWDGRGYPAGLAGEQISIAGRVLCLAQTAEVFWQHGGPSAACAVARKRSGRWFDPVLVDALVALEHDEGFWRSLRTTAVSELEPPDRVLVADEERLDRVAEAFASVVDAKSPYTARHSAGVADLAVGLAAALDLEAPVRANLWRAALLHDIGKLGVSNRILDKPDALTAAEWAAVRSHPRWSQEILSRVRAFSHLALIAGAHHERLDGSGYPNGLTGADLDLSSRILAVADVAEALGAKRPYRRALALEEVLAVTARESGRTLDADVCAALEDVLPAWQREAPAAAPGEARDAYVAAARSLR
jgi:HD-GYP domain-containing protein (c-di-GMP phosphodiesterase class II)